MCVVWIRRCVAEENVCVYRSEVATVFGVLKRCYTNPKDQTLVIYRIFIVKLSSGMQVTSSVPMEIGDAQGYTIAEA